MAFGHNNSIEIPLKVMFEGLGAKGKKEIDKVAKDFARMVAPFAKKLGINIDPKTVNTVADLSKRFQQLGVTIKQTGREMTAFFQSASGTTGTATATFKGITRWNANSFGRQKDPENLQTTTSTSRMSQEKELVSTYKQIISLKKQLYKLEGQGLEGTNAYDILTQSLDKYQNKLAQTENIILNSNKKLRMVKDDDLGNIFTGDSSIAKVQRNYAHILKNLEATKKVSLQYKANKANVNAYVAALKQQWQAEEELARLNANHASESEIAAQREVLNLTRSKAEALRANAVNTKEYKKVEEQLNIEEAKHKRVLAGLNSEGKKANSIFGNFKNTLKQVIQAGLSWKIFSYILRGLQGSVQVVTELNKNLVDLQIVTGKTKKEAEGLLKTYNEMAQTLGATTKEVATSANEWLRQGYSIEDTNELIKQSMILSKVGMVESAEASKYLTSAIKGYKKEVSDASYIVDMATKIDMQAAVSAGDLFEALAKTANLADEMGVEIHQAFAMIAAGMEVTQQDAGSFGTAMKTLLSRMSSVAAGKEIDEMGEAVNNVETSLLEQGIALRTSANEWRDYYDVLNDIATKMQTGELSGVALSKVTTALGGTRQREAVLTILQNWDKVKEYADSALNSVGTAAEKFKNYTEGIQGRIESLKASFDEFATKLINSGVIQFFIDLGKASLKVASSGFSQFAIKLGTVFVAVKGSVLLFNKFSKTMKNLGSSGHGLKNMIFALQQNFYTLRHNTAKAVESQDKLIESIRNSVPNFDDLTEAERKKIIADKKAAASAAALNAVLSITSLVITAVISVARHLEEVRQKNLENAKNTIESLKEETKEYEKLRQEFVKLASLEVQDDTTRQSIADVQAQIVKLVGGEAKGLGVVNDKLDEQLEKWDVLAVEKAKNAIGFNDATDKFDYTGELSGSFATIQKNLGAKFFDFFQMLAFNDGGRLASNLKSLGFDTMKIAPAYSANADLAIEEAEELLKNYKEARTYLDPNTHNKDWNLVNQIIKELEKRIKEYHDTKELYDETFAIAVAGLENPKTKEEIDSFVQTLVEQGYTTEEVAVVQEYLNQKLEDYTKIQASNNETSEESLNISQRLAKAKSDLADAEKELTTTEESLNEEMGKYNTSIDYAITLIDKRINKLKEEKSYIESEIKTYDLALDYISDYFNKQVEAIDSQINSLKEQQKAIEDSNKAKEREAELEKLLIDLAKSRQRTMRVYSEERGWEWVADPAAIKEAEENIATFRRREEEELQKSNFDSEIKSLENKKKDIQEEAKRWAEISKLKGNGDKKDAFYKVLDSLGLTEEDLFNMGDEGFGKFKDAYVLRQMATEELGDSIDELEGIKSQWAGLKDEVKNAIDSANAEVILGKDALNDLLTGDTNSVISVFKSFKTDFLTELNGLKGKIEDIVNRILGLKSKISTYTNPEDPMTKSIYGIPHNVVVRQNDNYIPNFAIGTKSSRAGLANIDEHGRELIIPPNQGRYQVLQAGTGILPHNLTERIFSMASNPSGFIMNALNAVKTPVLSGTSDSHNSSTTIEIHNIQMPSSVRDADSFVKELQLIAANR